MIRIADIKDGMFTAVQKIGQFEASKKDATFNGSVTWSGRTAYAVWKEDNWGNVRATVNFPAIADEAVLSRAEADRLTGYLLHELAHVWFTDLSVFHRLGAQSAFRKHLLNGLEDPRIELALIDGGMAPGARGCLTVLMQSLLWGEKVDASDIRNAPFIIAVLGRAALWGFPLTPGTFDIPAKVQPFFDLAIEGLKKAPLDRSGTEYLATVVDQLMQWLASQEPEQPQPQPQPQPGEQEGESDKQLGEGEGDEKGKGEGEGESDDSGKGEPSDGEPGDGEPGGDEQTDQTGAAGGFDSGADSLSSSEIREVEPDEAIERLAAEKDKAHPLTELDAYSGGKIAQASSVAPGVAEEIYSESLRSMGGRIGQLSNTLGRLLVSPERCGWDTQRPAGRFDARRGSQALSGYDNVYRSRWEKPGLTTDVMLLIDFSGSMASSRRSHRAFDTAVAMSAALDRLHGVRFGIYGFDAIYANRSQDIAGCDGMGGNRDIDDSVMLGLTRATLEEVKGFDEPLSKSKARIAHIPKSPGGGTPDVPAIKYAADVLRRRAASRKVLIVLTDGIGDYGPEMTGEAVRYAERSSVEVIGIGIGIDIGRCYPTSIKVSNPSDLAGKAMQAIVNRLSAKYQ